MTTKPEFLSAMKLCLKNGRFRPQEVMAKLNLKTKKQKAAIWIYLNSMTVSGQFKRVDYGVYEYIGGKKIFNRDRIWNVIRAKKQFDYDTLEELTGITRRSLRSFVYQLSCERYVKNIGSHYAPVYRLIKDSVERPQVPSRNKPNNKKENSNG